MNREIDFDKMQGLAPAIVHDAASGEVLLLGFMNREACAQTLSSGYVTFFSHTRNQRWTKAGDLWKPPQASPSEGQFALVALQVLNRSINWMLGGSML